MGHSRRKTYTGAAVLLVCSAAAAFAQNDGVTTTPPLFQTGLSRVAVFKNGYAFTFREGDARPDNGWVGTRQVPTGVLGTVWGYSLTPGVTVTQLSATQTQEMEARPVESLQELLLQNEGANVRMTVDRRGQKTDLEGKLQILTAHPRVPDSDSEPVVPAPESATGPFQVALRSEHGVDVVDLPTIEHVEILGAPHWDISTPIRRRLLSMKLAGTKTGEPAKVGVAALEKGIRWIPGYRIELQSGENKTAHVELEASVVNDLADVKDAEFYFVVGVPHFMMGDAISPLSLRTAFTGLSGFFSESQGGAYGNAIMTQQAFDNRSSMAGSPAETPALPDFDSSTDQSAGTLSAEQLFLYQAPHLSLKKGDRTSLKLFSATVPVTEVYEWTIEDSTPSAPRAYGNNLPPPSGLSSLEDRIWYALKLKNNSSMPWTTGPATSFSTWKPMGQDLMPFTAVGGSAIVKVTPATEIIGDHGQDEVARKRQATQFDGTNYDLVTVDGTIKLRNVKKTPVVVCVTRKTDGEIVSASDNAKIAREGLELQAVNPHSVITWEVTVPPGDKVLKYEYKRYVRS